MHDFTKSVAERFLRYTTFDTMSDDRAVGTSRPTTKGQLDLLYALEKECQALSLTTTLGPEAVLKATLAATDPSIPTIAFMAHVDTASDVMGDGVKAIRHFPYDGKDIILPSSLVLRVEDNPDLLKYIGQEIITSDGTTLLGSDDKAGVAIIMEALAYLVAHKEIRHGIVEAYFTPDEETGSGMNQFDYSTFDAKAAYTVDGEEEGSIECECFNAATVKVHLSGVSIHLGSARGKLVNALRIASAITMALPQAEAPEATDGRYGYYHVDAISGGATEADMAILIRDHDSDLFKERISRVESLVKELTSLYGGKAKIDTHISYRNMGDANRRDPKAIEAIFASGKELGFQLKECIIRGGTDGARLAEKTGVACPNIYTGGHNLHSLSEWVSTTAMSHATSLVLGIISAWAN